MKDLLTSSEVYTLALLLVVCLAVLTQSWNVNGEPLYASAAISGVAFVIAFKLIRSTGDAFIRRGFKGKDMSKRHAVDIPEAMGLICALVYLLAIVAFVPFAFQRDIEMVVSTIANTDTLEAQGIELGRLLHRFPMTKLASYGFASDTVVSMALLGFLDDTFDIRWRHKFFIPAIAATPLLALYAVDHGVTSVVVPLPLRQILGHGIDLGGFYYLYMAGLSIFCPNSINILAGINGIEVGQSLVIACLIVLNDVLYLLPSVHQPHPAADGHLFSIYLLLPLIGVSLALFCHNWYPAKVFVGDTYCYFAGMVFAVVAILGHFSKTLLLLFIPQLFNFVYSVPQLLSIVPCPRHRLPRYNARTNLLEPSVTTFPEEKPLQPIVGEALKILSNLKLLRVQVDGRGRVTESTNFTLLNLWLVWRGPMREDRLALEILAMQTIVGLLGLWARHSLALLLFAEDNRF